MNTKLTLTIDQSTIERAKIYARAKGRSLSDIIESYLKVITKEKNISNDISPLIQSLKGSFKAPENLDYKEELAKILSEKHL